MESGGCYNTNDMTSYLHTQLLVSDTICRDNRTDSRPTNNVWRRDYVKTQAFHPEAAVLFFFSQMSSALDDTESTQAQESPYNWPILSASEK